MLEILLHEYVYQIVLESKLPKKYSTEVRLKYLSFAVSDKVACTRKPEQKPMNNVKFKQIVVHT